MSKYKYNPETLQFEIVEISKKQRFFRYVITTIVTATVFCFILVLLYLYLIESPEQKQIKYENQALEKQYKTLLNRKIETDKVLKELQNRDKKIYQTVFEISPENDSLDIEDPYKKFERKNINSLTDSNTRQLNFLINYVAKQRKESFDLVKMLSSAENILTIPALQPIQNSDMRYMVYGYGMRIDPIYKTPSFHPGIDYACPEETSIYATADGTVTNTDEAKRGYGLQIRVRGGDYETVYAHLRESFVKVGQKVKRGERIGLSGNSGKSYAPHLHYEVLYKGKTVNPVLFFLIDLNTQNYSEMYQLAARGGVSLD